jgi:GGDEF domain-containing protein
MERDFSKREQEFTGIIGLLAETAAKLDQSNRGYYENLHRSVRSLKTIGNTEDISALRRALSERVGQLETTVSRQQTESGKVMAELRTGIQRVRTEAQVISKFVSTQALNRTPGRRHTERYLGDLARQEVPFVLAVIRLEKLDSLSRRHDDKAAEQVVQHFLSLLRDSLRRQVYLYRWNRDTIVALGDTISLSELGEPLRELTGQVARDGLRLDEISARPIGLHPRYTVQEVPDGTPLDETIRRIEQFSGDKA